MYSCVFSSIKISYNTTIDKLHCWYIVNILTIILLHERFLTYLLLS